MSKDAAVKVVFQGKIIEIVETDVEVAPGKVRTFEKARRAPGIRLIIIDEGKVLLTKEHRFELDAYDYRLPGGKVFDTLEAYNQHLASGDDILAAATKKAREEGQEEAGIAITELHHIHTSTLGATVEWDLYYFVVDKFSETNQSLEDGEDIEVVRVSVEEATAMALDGRMSEERSALILLRHLS